MSLKLVCLSSSKYHEYSTEWPEIETHNTKMDNAIEHYLKSRPTYAIIDKGRNEEERSYVYIEKVHLLGMGYISTDMSLSDISQAKDYIDLYKSNRYIMKVITVFAQKQRGKVCKV